MNALTQYDATDFSSSSFSTWQEKRINKKIIRVKDGRQSTRQSHHGLI